MWYIYMVLELLTKEKRNSFFPFTALIELYSVHFWYILLYFSFFTGEVQGNESLFNRSGTVNNAINYEPIFLEEIRNPELNFSVVLELCGDNKQCQYDYSVTGNEQIAKGTMKFIEKFKEIESDVQKGTELISFIHRL